MDGMEILKTVMTDWRSAGLVVVGTVAINKLWGKASNKVVIKNVDGFLENFTTGAAKALPDAK